MTESGGGWYPDPSGEPGRLRWWDGAQWTDRTRADQDEVAGGAGPVGLPRQRRPLIIGAVAAVAVLVVVGLVVANSSSGTSGNSPAARGERTLPTELPQAPTTPPAQTVAPCQTEAPQPTTPGAPNPSPPRASGPRVTDAQAGISYAGQAEPWQPWPMTWVTPGLHAEFSQGYFVVTQHDTPLGGDYYATVLSGTLTALVGDGPPANPRCVAEQLAEDVRGTYYPEPNERTTLEAHPITVSGHQGYVIRFHLSFNVSGYTAKGEQAAVLVLDTGRPKLAVLYLSVPDTVKGFDYVFPQVLSSVQAP